MEFERRRSERSKAALLIPCEATPLSKYRLKRLLHALVNVEGVWANVKPHPADLELMLFNHSRPSAEALRRRYPRSAAARRLGRYDRLMAQDRAAESAPVSVNFSAAEKRMLTRRSRDAGQTFAEHIRERVLAEADCEEQVLRFLANELTRTADEAGRVVAEGQAQPEASIEETQESCEAQRDRIVKEVRESFTQRELDSLARFFKLAFDAGLWPESRAQASMKGLEE